MKPFEAVKVTSGPFWPGDHAYRWIVSEPRHCWLGLSPSKKADDTFTIRVGWSQWARDPALNRVRCSAYPSPE